MPSGIPNTDERAERVEKWPPERIEEQRLEIKRARATCVPEAHR